MVKPSLILLLVAVAAGLVLLTPDVGLRLFYISGALGATLAYFVVRGLHWYMRRIAGLVLLFVFTSVIFWLLLRLFVQ